MPNVISVLSFSGTFDVNLWSLGGWRRNCDDVKPYLQPSRLMTRRPTILKILLRVLKRLPTNHFHLVLVGRGPDESRLRDLARDLGVIDFEFRGICV